MISTTAPYRTRANTFQTSIRNPVTTIAGPLGARARIGLLLVALAASAFAAGCRGGILTVRPPVLSVDQVRATTATVTPVADINSAADDFGVAMPLDTSAMYFTSSRNSREQRIYASRMAGGRWGTPQLAVEINNGRSNGTPSITPGGTTMYFAGDEYGFGDCDLYQVNIGPRGAVPAGEAPWSIPHNLGMVINGSYWDSEPCIAPDGSALYFASDRPGGFGGRDIWMCRRRHDGTWDTPSNLGERVNTEFDEVTPWITPDGRTLTFASNGRPGLGGFDVFAISTDASDQVRAQHLGTPINSAADDICLSMSANGQRTFVASNRPGGAGGLDIYEIRNMTLRMDPTATVRGTVHDQAGTPIPATIEVSDITIDKVIGRFVADPETGAFVLVLPRGANYGITASAPQHLFQSRQLVVPPDLERSMEQRIDFTLPPLNGSTRLLVFFETGQSNLLRESRNELDRVVRLLLDHPSLNVEIAGYTDSADAPEQALPLARDRAQAVKSYLVANRISADRITSVGRGAEKPVGDNATEEGRAQNRRVELRIVR